MNLGIKKIKMSPMPSKKSPMPRKKSPMPRETGKAKAIAEKDVDVEFFRQKEQNKQGIAEEKRKKSS